MGMHIGTRTWPCVSDAGVGLLQEADITVKEVFESHAKCRLSNHRVGLMSVLWPSRYTE